MTDSKTLENKLMEFYSEYETHVNLLQFFATSLLNDETDEIPRTHIDVMVETLVKQIEGKLQNLGHIIDEFQETYCK